MKTFFFAIFVAIFLFTGIGLYLGELNTVTQFLFNTVDTVQENIESNSWDSCEQAVLEMEKFWNRKKQLLSAFTNHDDLDNIEELIYDLKGSVVCQDLEESTKSANKLKVLFQRMKENEMPTWENILKYSPIACEMHRLL